MKAESIKVGMKIETADGTKLEIVRGWFKHEGFDSVEYRFESGEFKGQTEIAAVAYLQECFRNGTVKEIQ